MALGSDFRNFLDENLGIAKKAESKIAEVICELISFKLAELLLISVFSKRSLYFPQSAFLKL